MIIMASNTFYVKSRQKTQSTCHEEPERIKSLHLYTMYYLMGLQLCMYVHALFNFHENLLNVLGCMIPHTNS